MTCRDGSAFTEKHRARRLEAFSLVLQKKLFDINSLDRDGKTSLKGCKEPELAALFVNNGAIADVNNGNRENYRKWKPLEKAIYKVLIFDENQINKQKDREQEIYKIKVLAKSEKYSMENSQFEFILRQYCHQYIGGKPWNPETCKELSLFIKATPGTFK